jgi:hypothetical protein
VSAPGVSLRDLGEQETKKKTFTNSTGKEFIRRDVESFHH